MEDQYHQGTSSNNEIVLNILGRPIIRQSDIEDEDGGGSRWDHLVAIPDDDMVLIRMWYITASICLFVMFFVSGVFIAILRSPEAMKFSFNIYLLGLMVPDLIYASQSALVWYINAGVAQQYYNAQLCYYQSWFTMFGLGCNSWVNAIVAYELHKMLRHSHRRQHYTPPTRSSVLKQAAIVYLAMSLLSSISLFAEDVNLPIRTDLQNGFICTPLDYDLTSAIVIYCIYFPIIIGLPITYVLLVAFDVFFFSRLLPPQGKRRILTIYFFRMAFVFLFMWIPNSFVNYFFPRTPSMLKWAVIAWSHLQGFVAAATSLLKPDICQAVRQCFTFGPRSCCCCGGCTGTGGGPSSVIPDGNDVMNHVNANIKRGSLVWQRMPSSQWVIWEQADARTDSDRQVLNSSKPTTERRTLLDNAAVT